MPVVIKLWKRFFLGKGVIETRKETESLLQMDSYPAQVVAIKAIQELIRENMEQQEIIKQLQTENRELQELQHRVQKLEEKVYMNKP